MTSLYLSLATLTTTGYGDISPKNTPERMLAIFVFILGALVYGYVTANVSTIIGKISKNEARMNKFHSQIREYLDCEEISRKFLKEVTEHAKEIKRRCSTIKSIDMIERSGFRGQMVEDISIKFRRNAEQW